MEPLKVLIVAIRKDWQSLISDSLQKAGYHYQIENVATKQEALLACGEAKFDMVISNCTLPDGEVADLVSVLGKLLPCLVMAEGHCPVDSSRALSLLATDFYITSTDQSSWLSAMENTLSKWKQNAQNNLVQHQQNNSDLHRKILERCEEELSMSENAISNVLTMLLEALDLSRIYIFAKKPVTEGEPVLVQESEIAAPGVTRLGQQRTATQIPYFSRWNNLFKSNQPVRETYSSFPASEKQWFTQHGTESLLAVPIHSNGNWQGFIGLEDTLNARQWSEDEVGLMESVAAIIQKKHILNTHITGNNRLSRA